LSNWYTHQYVVNVPTGSNTVYDSLRIILGDVAESDGFSFLALFVTCGSAAGECPCFANPDYSCGAKDTLGITGTYGQGRRSCEVYVPLCECDGPIYMSVRSFVDNYNFKPTAYTLAAFLEGTSNVQSVSLPSTSVSFNRNLAPNINFDPILFDQYTFRFFLENVVTYWWRGSEGVYIYDSDLYVLPISSIAANRGLQFTIRYTTSPGTTERQQFAILSIGNDVAPPSNPFTSNCTTNCIAVPNGNAGSSEGWSYCTITLDPCQVESGNYYIRVSGASSINVNDYSTYNNPYPNSFDFIGVSYTLTVTQNDQSPVALTIGTPIRDTISESQYKHYSLALPNQANSGLRIHLYRNGDQGAPLTLYLNEAGALAGNLPCYSFTQQCQIIFGDDSSVCDFFIPACDYSQLAGKTVFVSVENQNFNPNFTSNGFYFDRYFTSFPTRVSHVAGDIPVQYTLSAQLVTIQNLDLNRGATVIGNVYEHTYDYYSYTVTQADITAGKVLYLELDSREPYSYYTELKTVISTKSPATIVPGDCNCGENILLNTFQFVYYPCDLTAGTYYVTVKALLDGFNTPFDPISYTLKAYYIAPITQSLSLSTTWTVAPHPLNFQESVVYSISVTASQTQVVQIEIADLPSSRDSFFADGIVAYLNFGVPGSPDCHYDVCTAVNNNDPGSVAAGTIMCRFTITPCEDCSGTYYLTINSNFIAPEPRIQYRSNYTVRAYTTSINTLDFFPSNYRNNATAPGGFNFAIQNTVNPVIQCDSRWSDTIFTDFFFRLPSITINQYEEFFATNSGINAGNIIISFSAGVSPSRTGDCGCDASPSTTCTLATGCTTGAQTIDVYARVGLASCGSNTFTNQTVNGIQFNTEVVTDLIYTALSQITVQANTPVGTTLAKGQYVVLRFAASSINFNLLPTITYNIDLSLSGGSVADRTCFVYGTGNLNAATFPGVLGTSSYCSLCTPMASSSVPFDGCCVDTADVLLLTVYNPPNSNTNSFNFTFTANVVNAVQTFETLSLPISKSYSSVRSDLATTFTFTLSDKDLHFDDVLNFRITSGNGTATAYLNSNFYADSTANCADWFFTCTTDQTNCIFQLPPCYFAGETNGIGYNQYYLSIIATSAPFVGPVNVAINVQRTTTISFPSSSNSGVVPDIAATPVDYQVNYRFQFPRTVGDQLLSGNNVALQVQLTPASAANNSLLLSINDPRFSSGSNPLAGPPLSGSNPAKSICDYHNDGQWQCFPSNNLLAGQTRNTAGNVGVTCFLYFCASGISQAELAKLYSDEFVYLSVQNTDASTGRVPTSFTVGVSVSSTALPSSQILYNISPVNSKTDQTFTGTCSNSSAITGGCNYSPSATVNTAYYLINLSSIGTWGINDYLLINVTNVVNTIGLTVWDNDQCEPVSGTVTLTCNTGEVCTFQGDPCQFTSLYRSDNGANSYITESRNLYLRVSSLGSTSSFNIAVLQVTPLQITVPLTAASPTYTNTFQSWEGRWTMFNFVLPKTQFYDFDISITSDCGTSTLPQIYLNEYTYQWASESCTELSATTPTTPFSWTHFSCEVDGNFFISVYTPLGSLQYSPIVIPEGRVSPQIKFTVTASLTKVVTKYAQYIWESEVSVPTGIFNYEAIGDNENFGTGLTIELASSNSVFLGVLTPLYRESFINDGYGFPVPQGNYNTAFYNADGFCSFPQCTDPGVYCCTDDSDCVINIPPCEYRNGRYYIYTDVSAPATLSSRIYRQDYITLTLGNTTSYSLSATGTLPLGPIFGDNINLNYYQFYQIVLTGDPFFLHVQLTSNVLELAEAYYYSSTLENYYNYGHYESQYFPILRGSLRRGDTGLSTSSDNGGNSNCQDGYCQDCSTAYCSTTIPGVCDFGEVECVDSVYFLGVWFQHDFLDDFADCDVLEYNLVVSSRDIDPITIEPSVLVCGTVQGTPVDFNYPPHYDGYGNYIGKRAQRDYFYRYVADDDDFAQYPTSVTYLVDLTGVDTTTDDVTVFLGSIQPLVFEQLSLSVSTTGPPSQNCNDCFTTTNPSLDNDILFLTIECGDYSELWITVSVTNIVDQYPLIIDYVFEVEFTKWAHINPSIPSLTFGVPSTVSFNLVSENSVLTFSTNNHQQALILPSNSFYIAGTPDYNGDCSNGCPQVETGCTFLGAEDIYYVYYSTFISTSSDVACFETPVTSVPSSIQVQSVHTLTVPANGLNNVTAYIQSGGVELFYVPLPAVNFNMDSITFFLETSIQTDIQVKASCQGFTAGAGCTNNVLFSFTESTTGTYSYFNQGTCGCDALYLTVSQIGGCGSGTSFTLGVEVLTSANPFPVVPLTNNVYIADTLPVFGYQNPNGVYRIYSLTSTADKFVHASINRANNTAGPNDHSITGLLLNSNGCLLSICTTGVYTSQDFPFRAQNSEDSSCYLYSTVPANQPYYIVVESNEDINNPPASAATYRINSIVSYTDLETTASQNFQLIGFDRQYFKVNGRVGGLATNNIQSVVITLNLIDGDRVAIIVADQPNYINLFETQNTASYNGWARSKVCYFGECTIEISTRAQHSGANVFYVWVETVTTEEFFDYRLEKPVNYKISATTGLNNCEANSNFITGFCASTVSTLTSVYAYRDVNARNLEAQSRFNNFLCRCQPPTADCIASLTRFSCLESFRECDSRGFWTPICRSECLNLDDTCGGFALHDPFVTDCTCARPEFTCSNTRYSDVTNGQCTGKQVVSPSTTPSRAPSASSSPLPSGASRSNSPVPPSTSHAGGSKSSTRTPSPHAGASHSSTPAPSSGGNSNDVTIKYYIIYENSASSLVPSTLLFLFAIFFFLF